MLKGVRPTAGIEGPPAAVVAVPWTRIVVPCGMEASRAMVVGSCGSVVGGMLIHTPGSICSPAGAPLTSTLASEICCRYVSPCMTIWAWTRPRFGICPLMTSRSIWSLVTFSSRKWSDAPLCGRQMALKPWPLQLPARPASGPSPAGAAAAAGVPVVVVQRLEGKVCGQFHDSPSARAAHPCPEAIAELIDNLITVCLMNDGSCVPAARQCEIRVFSFPAQPFASRLMPGALMPRRTLRLR